MENYMITLSDERTVEMRPIKHKEMRAIRRNPTIVSLLVDMARLAEQVKTTPDDAPEKGEIVLNHIVCLTSLLEESAAVVVEMQHPGLIDTLSFDDANTLLQGVVDNNIKDAYGLGEAMAALDQAMEAAEDSESMTSNSTSTSSTPSVES